MNENLILEKLDAHDRWLERRYWCVEQFGEEDVDVTWWWDPIVGQFFFVDPKNETHFRLVWG